MYNTLTRSKLCNGKKKIHLSFVKAGESEIQDKPAFPKTNLCSWPGIYLRDPTK